MGHIGATSTVHRNRGPDTDDAGRPVVAEDDGDRDVAVVATGRLTHTTVRGHDAAQDPLAFPSGDDYDGHDRPATESTEDQGARVPPDPRDEWAPSEVCCESTIQQGAGVLCCAAPPTDGDALSSSDPVPAVFFLFGRGAPGDRAHVSGRWSDFGGRAEPGEEPEDTAAREFFEESMGLAAPLCGLGRPDRDSVGRIAAMLRERRHCARIDVCLNHGAPQGQHHQRRYYATFVLPIAWDPTLPDTFARVRHNLVGIGQRCDEARAAYTRLASARDRTPPDDAREAFPDACDAASSRGTVGQPTPVDGDGDDDIERRETLGTTHTGADGSARVTGQKGGQPSGHRGLNGARRSLPLPGCLVRDAQGVLIDRASLAPPRGCPLPTPRWPWPDGVDPSGRNGDPWVVRRIDVRPRAHRHGAGGPLCDTLVIHLSRQAADAARPTPETCGGALCAPSVHTCACCAAVVRDPLASAFVTALGRARRAIDTAPDELRHHPAIADAREDDHGLPRVRPTFVEMDAVRYWSDAHVTEALANGGTHGDRQFRSPLIPTLAVLRDVLQRGPPPQAQSAEADDGRHARPEEPDGGRGTSPPRPSSSPRRGPSRALPDAMRYLVRCGRFACPTSRTTGRQRHAASRSRDHRVPDTHGDHAACRHHGHNTDARLRC